MEFCRLVEERGFAIVSDVFTSQEIDELTPGLLQPSLRRSRAGIRHVLGLEAVAKIAAEGRILELIRPILGGLGTLVR